MFRVSILFAISLLFSSCGDENGNQKFDSDSYFIYTSHTRAKGNDSLVSSIYDIDFTAFDGILLGGDLATYTFRDGMENHVDSIFNLKNPNVLWSIGNHDETSEETFFELTGKKKAHLYQTKDLSIITLNTQDSVSSIVGKQKEFLLNALDTVTTKNVIVMSHKLIFMDKHPVMDKLTNRVCNVDKGDCPHCHNPNNFRKEIYPELTKASNKNIIWIGGDLGFRSLSFEYRDQPHLLFLGNGMDYKRQDNEVVIFRKQKDTVTHHIVKVDSLIHHQKWENGLKNLLK